MSISNSFFVNPIFTVLQFNPGYALCCLYMILIFCFIFYFKFLPFQLFGFDVRILGLTFQSPTNGCALLPPLTVYNQLRFEVWVCALSFVFDIDFLFNIQFRFCSISSFPTPWVWHFTSFSIRILGYQFLGFDISDPFFIFKKEK